MSIVLPRPMSRRAMLRGAFRGASVGVALPFLDCFLDTNGTALAANGAPLPVRFGTWFWGLGQTPGRAVSAKTGPGIEFLEECKALIPYRDHINYFSNFNTFLDGATPQVHFTGWVAARTGEAPPREGAVKSPTLDVLIGDVIGTGTRFRALDAASTGNPKDTYSFRNTGSFNTPEVSPLAFYTRIFGPEFADPNKADFKPDPDLMVRQSVLSAVGEDSKRFVASLGAADKSRIDQYFTSIRQLENQLALQTQKPPVNMACAAAGAPAEGPVGLEINTVLKNHKLLTDLMAMAVACNQTKVFNMIYSNSGSNVRRLGESQPHHNLTHEEPADPKLGYQVQVAWFNCRQMEAFASFVEAFGKIPEGDGTLLDHVLIFANSDTNNAKLHAIDGVPMMTAGRAGGRIKTGMHVDGNGDAISRVGLTMQRVMGVPVEAWGAGSMRTTKPVGEILA